MDHVPAKPLLRSIKSFLTKIVGIWDGISCFNDINIDYNNSFACTSPSKLRDGGTVQSKEVAQPRIEKAAAAVKKDANEDDDSDSDGEEEWFGATRHIPHERLQKLAISHFGDIHGLACVVEDICEGSYNRAHIMRFPNGTKYVIRVPGWGTEERWVEGDAVALRLQACTMNYIRRKTGLPVPEVLAYNTSCDNMLGHPYMITTFLPGRQVCEVWEEGDQSPERELKRIAILKSIAQTISKLSSLSFNAAGSLYFHDGDDCEPEVGPLCVMEEGFHGQQHTATYEPAYTNSYQKAREKLAAWWQSISEGGAVPWRSHHGMYMILAILIDCLPFHKSTILVAKNKQPDEDGSIMMNDQKDCEDDDCTEGKRNSNSTSEEEVQGNAECEVDSEDEDEDEKETFVLVPPDFNWQNILIDENNNVTGLLDWDKVATVPRFLGWSAPPLWLSDDWCANYVWDGTVGNSEHDLERYRHAYADFMAEAMNGKGDCKFTAKSHLFETLWVALDEKLITMSALGQFLKIVLPRTDSFLYADRIPNGWKPGERVWLRKKLGELLECTPGADRRFSY